jgi:glycosyltransferase involved in cell wall biosynthesis
VSEANSPNLSLSLVVPAYNEVDSLALLHEKIRAAVEPLNLAWEVIYIDDGSTDHSADVMCGLQRQDDHVVVAVLRRNSGKSLALDVGFSLARGQTIITMDADLQDEPAEIPRLLAKLDEGYDLVTGWKQDRQDPITKRLPSWIANQVTGMVTGLHLHDMNSGLKAFRADCARDLRLYGDLHRYIPVLSHFNGYRVTEIPVVHHKRQFGRSKFGAGRLLRGVIMLLAGFLINLYLSIEWFEGVRPLSQRPLLTLGVLLMVMGVQLLTMGLLAEMIVSFIRRSEDPLRIAARVYRPTDEED